jgi:hypothetical protein
MLSYLRFLYLYLYIYIPHYNTKIINLYHSKQPYKYEPSTIKINRPAIKIKSKQQRWSNSKANSIINIKYTNENQYKNISILDTKLVPIFLQKQR